jgi:hypothetical protein
LTGVAGKDVFRGDAGGVGLAGDDIEDIKARVDVIAGVDIIITT